MSRPAKKTGTKRARCEAMSLMRYVVKKGSFSIANQASSWWAFDIPTEIASDNDTQPYVEDCCHDKHAVSTTIATATAAAGWDISPSTTCATSSTPNKSPYAPLGGVSVSTASARKFDRLVGHEQDNEVTYEFPRQTPRVVASDESISMTLLKMIKTTGKIDWRIFDANLTTPSHWRNPQKSPWATRKYIYKTKKARIGLANETKASIQGNAFPLVTKQRHSRKDCVIRNVHTEEGGGLCIIRDPYMGEFVHSCLLSTLFERGISPHFPLVSMLFVEKTDEGRYDYTQVMEYCGWSMEECLQDSSLYNISAQCTRMAHMLKRNPQEVLAEVINQTILEICAGLASADRDFGFVHHDCIDKNLLHIPLYSPPSSPFSSKHACAPFRGKPIASYRKWYYVVDRVQEGVVSQRIICPGKPYFLTKITDFEYASCSDVAGPDGKATQVVLGQQMDGDYSDEGVCRGRPSEECKGYDVHHVLTYLGRLAGKHGVLDLTIIPELHGLRRSWKINPASHRPYVGHVNNCTPREILLSSAFDGWQVSREEFEQDCHEEDVLVIHV